MGNGGINDVRRIIKGMGINVQVQCGRSVILIRGRFR